MIGNRSEDLGEDPSGNRLGNRREPVDHRALLRFARATAARHRRDIEATEAESIAGYALTLALEHHDPARGDVRPLLVTTIRRLIANERRARRAVARGGTGSRSRPGEWRPSPPCVVVSLDGPAARLGEGRGFTLAETIEAPSDDDAEDWRRERAEELLARAPLTPKQRQALRLALGGATMRQVGRALGISTYAATQAVAVAVERVRDVARPSR